MKMSKYNVIYEGFHIRNPKGITLMGGGEYWTKGLA